VRDPLLRADEWHDLGEGIEGQPEATLHPERDGLAKGGKAQAEAIAAHARVARSATERLDHGRRWGEVSVACSEVDDVHTSRDQLALPLRNGCQRVLREGANLGADAWH
jgi:hypothetical protein